MSITIFEIISDLVAEGVPHEYGIEAAKSEITSASSEFSDTSLDSPNLKIPWVSNSYM